MDMNLNQKKTLFFERNHIVFEFSVIDNLPYNFIHPEAMFYWIIEPPRVLNWNEPFNFTLSPEGSKSSFPCKGIERLSRELVKCSDGVFRTCAKVKIEVICNSKQYDVDFYVDKTLQHTGTIGSDLGNRIKRNE